VTEDLASAADLVGVVCDAADEWVNALELGAIQYGSPEQEEFIELVHKSAKFTREEVVRRLPADLGAVVTAAGLVCDAAEDVAMELTGSDDEIDETTGWELAGAIDIVRGFF
jgi:ATP/maltotriose-dependent transcriptional regulator MalT